LFSDIASSGMKAAGRAAAGSVRTLHRPARPLLTQIKAFRPLPSHRRRDFVSGDI
jgi:hypothetical protein